MFYVESIWKVFSSPNVTHLFRFSLQKKRLSIAASISDTESLDGKGSSTPPQLTHSSNSLERSQTPDERLVVVKVTRILWACRKMGYTRNNNTFLNPKCDENKFPRETYNCMGKLRNPHTRDTYVVFKIVCII